MSNEDPVDSVMRRRAYLSCDRIQQWIDAIAPELRTEGFSGVVAVLRGGLFPAQCVSFATGAPLAFVRYDRASQTAAWVGDVPPPGRLLVCEDVAGSGMTLSRCLALVAQSHPDHRVLTVVSDEQSRIRPAWSLSRPGLQTVFPWERHDQSPAHRHDWQAGGADGSRPMRADHEYRFWGVDLDGVMCADLPPQQYEADLQACLALRDALPLAASAPRLHADRHVLITGRPRVDAQRTKAWLARHGFHDIAVHHRDPDSHSAVIEAVARHKAASADRLGCSDFIESCPQQALLIAALVPHIRTHWWADGRPLLVSAAATRLEFG